MSALGDSFRTARESQGITLSEAAERTHIRSVYLEAIEAEDWNVIGPPVYVRGFLRSYARFLGLDPETAVTGYAATAPGATTIAPLAQPSVRPEPVIGERGPGAKKRGLSIGAVASVLVAFVLVLFVGFEYVDYQRDRAAPVNAVTAPPARHAPRPVRAERDQSLPTATSVAQRRAGSKGESRPSGFAVDLRDNSWLRIVVDGKLEMEGVYPKGTQRTFAGRSAIVRVGNAGGVDISVDGKDLGPMGGLGDVAERAYQR
jgi:cytoskeleton protein RodZ